MLQRQVHLFQGVILQVLLCVCIWHNAWGNVLKSDSFQCKRLDACRCLLTKDEGYDLSLSKEDDKWLSTGTDSLTFYFHPCTDKRLGNKSSECYGGVSMCLFNHTNGEYKNLGYANETSVESQGTTGAVQFVIRHNRMVTRLLLECDAEVFPSLLADNMTGPDQYVLRLKGLLGCRQHVGLHVSGDSESEAHLSTGSVLVIILVVLTSVYLVGGALTLKLLRGAEGLEMIPNYDFWASLPGLVKEGFLFTLSGFKTPQAYDRI